jgi:hypothetical protein
MLNLGKKSFLERKSDHINQIITSSVITLSRFYCSIFRLGQSILKRREEILKTLWVTFRFSKVKKNDWLAWNLK